MESRYETTELLRAKCQQEQDEKYRSRAPLIAKVATYNQGNEEFLPDHTPADAGAAATSKWNDGLIRSTIIEMNQGVEQTQNTILSDAYLALQNSVSPETTPGEASLSAAFICGSDVHVTHIGNTRLILLTKDNDDNFVATRLTFDHVYTKMDVMESEYFEKNRLVNISSAIEGEQNYQSGIQDFTRLLGRDKAIQEPNHFHFKLAENSGETYLLAVTAELTLLMQERNIAECLNNNKLALNESPNKAQSIAGFLAIEAQQRNAKTVAAVLAIDVSKPVLPTLCYITEGRESIELAAHINTALKEHVVNKFNEQLAQEKAAAQQVESEKEIKASAYPFTFLNQIAAKATSEKASQEQMASTEELKTPTKVQRPQPIRVPGGSADSGSCRIC